MQIEGKVTLSNLSRCAQVIIKQTSPPKTF